MSSEKFQRFTGKSTNTYFSYVNIDIQRTMLNIQMFSSNISVDCQVRIKPGCLLRKYARKCACIYALAYQLEKFLNCVQA